MKSFSYIFVLLASFPLVCTAQPNKLVVLKTYYNSFISGKPQLFEEYQVFSNNPEEKAGAYRQYSRMGNLQVEGTYANNLPTGPWKYYGYNSLDSVVTYKMGVRNGEYISYYSGGTRKKKQGKYVNNLPVEKWTYYKNDSTNSMDAIISLNERGEQDGNCITYFKNGQVDCNAYYASGTKTGTWTIYKENGTVLTSFEFNNNNEAGTLAEHTREAEIFDRVEVMPSYPGGVSELFKFLSKSIRYPSLARENGLEGKVIVKFFLDELGFVRDVSVLKDGVGGGCGEESVRVVHDMPRWIPGLQKGKPVKVYYTLPITYKLQ